jgi:hypothetical protein
MRKFYTINFFRISLALLFSALFTGGIHAQWRTYDGSALPNLHVPTFTPSNTAGNGGINTIITDPENELNSFLELITAENADNYMWSTPLQPSTAAITIVMKVKAANDVSRRVVELDLHHGGFRERLYINRESNRVRLNEAIGGGDGGEIPAPDGVSFSDWNIYRLTKSGGDIKLYLNEDVTPIAQGTTSTNSSNQYFRFGDGNGSHNGAALIDWIIWDETGAYAPDEGTAIPNPVVTPSWNANLQEIKVNGISLVDFDPATLSYTVSLPFGSALPVLSANSLETEATVEVTQATELPGQATILVTAPNGYTTKTYTLNFEEAPHNWYIYDAKVLPNLNVPVFGTSGLVGNGMVSNIVVDPGNSENSFLELLTTVNADNGTWRRVYTNPVDAITIVMRVKSANDDGRRVLELDLDNGGFRERLYINQEDNKLRLNHSEGFGSANEFSLPGDASVKDWHIYRITKDAEGNVKLYVDENPIPLAEGKTLTTTSNNHFRFGDTNGSHNVSGLVDWIIWDKTGTYAPGEGSGIPDPVVTPPWDATLSNLLADGLPIDGFAADKYSYEIVLPAGTVDIPVITASANHAGASVQIIQATEIPGDAIIEVTAENGFTVLTYTVTIRNVSSDATLTNLLADGQAITGFDPDVTDYELVLPIGTTDIPVVSAVTNFTGASTVITQADAIPGTATVVVTAEDGATTKTYTISMRLISNNASLADLKVDNVTVTGFSAGVFTYNIQLPAGTTSATVSAEPADANASIQVTQATALPGTATVVVTAEDGTEQTYTINFTLDTTGIGAPEVPGFRFYPNPAGSFLAIEWFQEEVAFVEIINLSGQVVLRKQLKSTLERLEISHLGKGTYILNITSGNNKSSRMFFKQ